MIALRDTFYAIIPTHEREDDVHLYDMNGDLCFVSFTDLIPLVFAWVVSQGRGRASVQTKRLASH